MMLHGRKGGQHLAGQVILEVLLGGALLQKNSREYWLQQTEIVAYAWHPSCLKAGIAIERVVS